MTFRPAGMPIPRPSWPQVVALALACAPLPGRAQVPSPGTAPTAASTQPAAPQAAVDPASRIVEVRTSSSITRGSKI